MKKNILFLLPFLLVSVVNAGEIQKTMIKNLDLEKKRYEVYTKPNGDEEIFETITIRPNMVFEEHLILKRKKEGNQATFVYVHQIGGNSYYKGQKPEKGVFYSYSSNGVDFHKELDKPNDKFLKIEIPELSGNASEKVIKVRYEYTLFR